MGIALSVVNDTDVEIEGQIYYAKKELCKLNIVPKQKWTRTDNGIQRDEIYTLKLKQKGSKTKYTYHVIAPSSRGEKVIQASEIFTDDHKSKRSSEIGYKLSMNAQIGSAVKILRSFTKKSIVNDCKIPPEVIYNAKGLAFITQTKVGFLFSVSGGMGIVITRTQEGDWSGPSCFGCAGLGAGIQFGASITRSLLVLNNDDAVKAFMGEGQVKLGASVSVAAGPVGRAAELEARGGKGKVAAIFSYAISQGLFGGVSVDGAVLTPRKKENSKFYGVGKLKTKDILSGKVEPPENTRLKSLYLALAKLESRTGMQMDGQMHPAAIAALCVFQPVQINGMVTADSIDSGEIRGEPLDYLKATLFEEEIWDMKYAFESIQSLRSNGDFFTNMVAVPSRRNSTARSRVHSQSTSQRVSELASSEQTSKRTQDTGLNTTQTSVTGEDDNRVRDSRASTRISIDLEKYEHQRNDSKAVKQLRKIGTALGIEWDLIGALAKAIATQFSEKKNKRNFSFAGADLFQWVIDGYCTVMHPAVANNESDKIQLLLAHTLIAKEDIIDVQDHQAETQARLLEIRILVMLNLLLKDGYIEPKRLIDLETVKAAGFQMFKQYRFTILCGPGYERPSRHGDSLRSRFGRLSSESSRRSNSDRSSSITSSTR